MSNTDLLVKQLTALLGTETDPITILANTSALVNETIDQVNWVGFYRYDPQHQQLNLGPFQGKVACMHIKLGQGVCGQAAQEQQTLVVDDVTTFPGYISCDAAAQSEVVVPLVKRNGQLYGVFDLDAPVKNRFDKSLVNILTETAQVIMKSID